MSFFFFPFIPFLLQFNNECVLRISLCTPFFSRSSLNHTYHLLFFFFLFSFSTLIKQIMVTVSVLLFRTRMLTSPSKLQQLSFHSLIVHFSCILLHRSKFSLSRSLFLSSKLLEQVSAINTRLCNSSFKKENREKQMWEISKKLGVLVLTVSLVLPLSNKKREQQQKNGSGSRLESASSSSSFSWIRPLLFSTNDMKIDFNENTLEYDFYRDSCPQAEQIVRSTMHRLYKMHSSVAPALLRLLFHDCFIQGCDASVLLDSTSEFQSEKDTPPNQTLKGFHIIEMIKSKLEEVCSATVSCADILVLSAREGVALAGGPYYPLPTGRRDSFVSFPEVASYELPSPHDDLSKTLTSFASRGFDERETVSLLGAHNIGKIHCRFFRNRLYNFQGTGLPDPSLEAGYLNLMRSRCNNSKSHSEEPGMNMGYEGKKGPEFGTHYYKTLMQGKGILHADQQLLAGEGTASWVEAYASERSLFRRDSAQVMMKLSSLRVLARSLGQIKLNCSRGSFKV